MDDSVWTLTKCSHVAQPGGAGNLGDEADRHSLLGVVKQREGHNMSGETLPSYSPAVFYHSCPSLIVLGFFLS